MEEGGLELSRLTTGWPLVGLVWFGVIVLRVCLFIYEYETGEACVLCFVGVGSWLWMVILIEGIEVK